MLLAPYNLALYILAAAWGLVVAAAIRAGRSGASLLAALGYMPLVSYYYRSGYQAVYTTLLLVFHSSLLGLIIAHTAGVIAVICMINGCFSQTIIDLYIASRDLVALIAPLAAIAAALLLAARFYAMLRHRLRPPICPLLLEAGVIATYMTALYASVWLHLVAALLLAAVTAPAMRHVSRASRLASKALLRRVRGVPGA